MQINADSGRFKALAPAKVLYGPNHYCQEIFNKSNNVRKGFSHISGILFEQQIARA